jgi:hypothetical protein
MSGPPSDDIYNDSFDSHSSNLARRTDPGQATQIEQARAIAEVRAMVMIAMENPRNEDAARRKMQRVCQMPSMAERAFFRVPRGTKKDERGNVIKDEKGKPIPEFVNGETIQLARELARCWGNIDYSVREMSRNDQKGQSEMMACAWDLEENNRSSTVFIVAHQIGKFKVTSNQQIYENNASHAGRRLREMIFNALPEWFKAEAIDLCHETLKRGDGKPMAARIDACIEMFREMGVSIDMLQKRIGCNVREMTPEILAQLRIVAKSIKRNEVTIGDEFPVEGAAIETTPNVAPDVSGSRLDQLENKVVGETAKSDAAASAGAPFGPDDEPPALSPDAKWLIEQVEAAKDANALDALLRGTAVAAKARALSDADRGAFDTAILATREGFKRTTKGAAA